MAENITECQYCGKGFEWMPPKSQRKYCSASCGWKARYRSKHPGKLREIRMHEKSVFESAMKMHESGMMGVEIAQRLGVPKGTVHYWTYKFGSKNMRNRERIGSEKSLKERFKAARDSNEWVETLRENSPQDEDTFAGVTVNLVCGVLHGYSAGKFASVVAESLHEDPLSGKSYAFCNKCRNTISVLAWKSPIFLISKYIRTNGTFIWPEENLGGKIEISRAEFDRLIFLQKSRKSSLILREETPQIMEINTVQTLDIT